MLFIITTTDFDDMDEGDTVHVTYHTDWDEAEMDYWYLITDDEYYIRFSYISFGHDAQRY